MHTSRELLNEQAETTSRKPQRHSTLRQVIVLEICLENYRDFLRLRPRLPTDCGFRNCSSSTGAPSSTMNATRTPGEGVLGAIRICFPLRASSRSSTTNAT